LTLERFARLPHALITPSGGRGGVIDKALARHGLARRVVMQVPQFLVAPLIVARSDLVLLAPERLARTFAGLLPLRILEPPLEFPAITIHLFWHERHQRDPAHAWMRRLILELGKSL